MPRDASLVRRQRRDRRQQVQGGEQPRQELYAGQDGAAPRPDAAKSSRFQVLTESYGHQEAAPVWPRSHSTRHAVRTRPSGKRCDWSSADWLPESNTRTFAVLGNEDDASGFEGPPDRSQIIDGRN